MDPRYVVTSKYLIDQDWDIGNAGTREYSAAQLDAIADVTWPWDGLQRAVVACVRAMRAHWTFHGMPLGHGSVTVRLHPR